MKKVDIISKYQIDFAGLQEATDIRPARKYFTWIQNTLGGTFLGMGVGSTVSFIISWAVIAIAGITLAALFTTLAVVTGGLIIAAFSLYAARQQTKNDELVLKTAKENLDKDKEALQQSVMNVADSLQALNSIIKNKYRLLVDKGIIKDSEEEFLTALDGDQPVKNLRIIYSNTADEELEELQKIFDARRLILRKLTANLAVVSGNSYGEKLANLFNTSEQKLIETVSNKAEEKRRPGLEKGMQGLIHELSNMPLMAAEYSKRSKVEDRSAIRKDIESLQTVLAESYKTEHERKDPLLLRRLTRSYGMAAVGGFFTGIGGYMAIGSLIVGGAATLLTGGAALPILLGAVAVGLAFAGVAVLYRYHVERKKRDAMKTLQRSDTALKVIKADLDNTNNQVQEVLKVSQEKQQKEAQKVEDFKQLNTARLTEFVEIKLNKAEKLAKELLDLQGPIEASRMMSNKRDINKDLQIQLNLKHLEALYSLKQKYEKYKLACENRAQELKIEVNVLQSLYQPITINLLAIEKTITELETTNQYYKKSLLEKGEQVKQPQYREDTVKDLEQKSEETPSVGNKNTFDKNH